jgi:hypothetical protein
MCSAATREFARFLNGLNLAQLVARFARTGMWDDIDDPLRFEWTHKSFARFSSGRAALWPCDLGYVMVGCHAGSQTQNWLSGTPHRHQLAAYCLKSAAAFPDSLGFSARLDLANPCLLGGELVMGSTRSAVAVVAACGAWPADSGWS